MANLCLAASKLRGVERRSFQAEMTLKYCQGSARMAERVFGWGRESVGVGLAEKRTEIRPIERCWGILEHHWNGTQLKNVNTMLQWAKSMTWKGIHPIVGLNQQIYAKGVALSKTAMRGVENRLQRNPDLPKWDILIQPTHG